MISIRLVQDKTQLRDYINLPYELYAADPQWVPPLYGDEKKFHDPRHNEAYAYCDVERWLAYDNGVCKGRIMGIINHPYNTAQGEATARFYQLDCVNDQQVSKALLHAVESWAKQKSMQRIIGPFGFSDKDPQGIRIEGFEQPAVLLTPANPPYMRSLIEQQGYAKELDCVSYELPIPQELPPAYQRICERVRSRNTVFLKTFTRRSQLKPFIKPVLHLVNETYKPIFGFLPLSDNEIEKLAAQYLPILNPKLVKLVVSDNNEPVGFVISMPGITQGLQKSRGRLFPFGFIHILWSLQFSRQLVLLLGAVKPGFRGKGVTALLAEALFHSARERGMEVIDTHLILENNMLMRAEVENLGARIYKRYRVYQKSLEA